ncbi:MAG TPA: hypothetical protein VER10_10370 [Mycobacterium sp.]|nr:hypothetical protein [Mycobacterium sp.]
MSNVSNVRSGRRVCAQGAIQPRIPPWTHTRVRHRAFEAALPRKEIDE